jgi:two-component system, NarL family, nitrate/nitrite response regulator NarL
MDPSKKIIRLLLVDDHKSFSDGLAMLINTNKSVMEVVGKASNRREALNLATRVKPDIVLLDVDLGEDNGLEMLPEINAATDAKVIILTGAVDPEIHQAAILRGAQGVLLKTDPAQVILKAIEKVYKGEVWISNDTLNRVLGQLTQQRTGFGKKEIDPEEQKIASLTAREREIIRVLANDESSTNKEIADRLFISDSTLKNHLTTIYSKLEVKNRIDLLKYALNHKLDKSQ